MGRDKLVLLGGCGLSSLSLVIIPPGKGTWLSIKVAGYKPCSASVRTY